MKLPSSLERISDYMFYMCTSLKKINFPKALVEIGAFAFNHTALTSVTFHDGIERIGDYSFEGTSVTSVILPPSCRYLGSWAFFDCASLSRTYLGRELEFVGSGVFYGCGKLPAIDYGGSEGDWKKYGSGLTAPVIDGKPVNFDVER